MLEIGAPDCPFCADVGSTRASAIQQGLSLLFGRSEHVWSMQISRLAGNPCTNMHERILRTVSVIDI